MFKFRDQLATVARGIGILGVFAASTVPTSASAGVHVPSTVTALTGNALQYVNYVRTFFLCGTATCVANQQTNERAAVDGLTVLTSDIAHAHAAHLAAPYASIVESMRFETAALTSTINSVIQSTPKFVQLNAYFVINYQTSFIASDVYRLQAVAHQASTNFSNWNLGPQAALTATSYFQHNLATAHLTKAEQATTDNWIISTNEDLKRHSNGPSPTYNTKLRTLASGEITVATNALRVVTGKPATLSPSRLNVLNVSLASQLRSVEAMSKSLSSAKKS